MNSEYWRIFCDEVVPDVLGVNPSKEQIDRLHAAIMGHREMEWEACGYREADKSIMRMEIQDAKDKVFRFIEGLMADMDRGSGAFFEKLNDIQKTALATLGNARRHFETQQPTKG